MTESAITYDDWIAALRSGQYRQVCDGPYREGDCFCLYGTALDLIWPEQWSRQRDDGEWELIQPGESLAPGHRATHEKWTEHVDQYFGMNNYALDFNDLSPAWQERIVEAGAEVGWVETDYGVVTPLMLNDDLKISFELIADFLDEYRGRLLPKE